MKRMFWIAVVSLFMAVSASSTHAGLANGWGEFSDAKGLVDNIGSQLRLRQGALVTYGVTREGWSVQSLTTASLYDLVIGETRYLSADVGYTPQETVLAGVSANFEPWIAKVPYAGEAVLRVVDYFPGDFLNLEAGAGIVHSYQEQQTSFGVYFPVVKLEF